MEKRHGALGFGLFLLIIGVLWILVTTGVITWSILNALYVLWPLIIVVIGVNIIFRRNGFIRAGVWIVFLAVLVTYGYYFEDKNPTATDPAIAGKVSIDKQTETRNADLTLALGGTKLYLDSDTAKLLEASLPDSDTKYSSNLQDNNSKANIVFKRKSVSFDSIKNMGNAVSSFHLNKDVVWNLELDTGAIDGSLDMSELKVENLDIKIGAANTKLTMGSYNTRLNIDGGASNIEIDVPGDTGIKIKYDGGLNDTNTDGPGWEKRDGWNYSPGYDSKEYKIEANVKMGVGRFTVNFP